MSKRVENCRLPLAVGVDNSMSTETNTHTDGRSAAEESNTEDGDVNTNATGTGTDTLLSVSDLRTVFYTDRETIRAVDGISFDVARGETVGLVGESGSGKSVTARSIMGLIESSGQILDGSSIQYENRELVGASDDEWAQIYGGEITMVFQDPLTSLNPVYTVGNQIKEALRLHQGLRGSAATQEAIDLLEAVGIPDASRRVREYPHEFSGGMRQRAIIAMALACEPDLLICDEPTTALDVTIQAQILELLQDIQAERNLSIIFITHDMGVIAEIADRVNVMYAGEIVETAPIEELYANPKHPYTQGLLESIPGRNTDDGETRLKTIEGDVPTPNAPPTDCRFAPRCPKAFADCEAVHPVSVSVNADAMDHTAACLLYPEDEPRDVAVNVHQVRRTDESDPDGTEDGVGSGNGVPYNREKREKDAVVSDTEPIRESDAEDESKSETLVKVRNLKTYYESDRLIGGTPVKAVDGVGFEIQRGETLGLVGESGCGKTTLGRTLIQLEHATEGNIRFDGRDITSLSGDELTAWRRNAQIVFQDPDSSLNGRMTVGEIVREPLDAHDWQTPQERRDRVHELLETVGLREEHYYRYPHQFSGGQRQRVGIARALALEPEFIVLDEPVSALDVSVQAKILNLLENLQNKFELTYLFIAHDLSVVQHLCDRVAVMYLGNLMEVGPTDELFANPANPYTYALLSAIPDPDPTNEKERITLRGTPPSPRDPPTGCPFSTRCPAKIKPETYANLDDKVWERIEVFREILRERERADRSLAERAREYLGLETQFSDVEEINDEVFGDVDVPPEVGNHIDRAEAYIREGAEADAQAYLREEFGSICDRESPPAYDVSTSGRVSHCHRNDTDYESPADNFQRMDVFQYE